MKIEQYYSDDYAGLDTDNIKFYYGYEVTNPKDPDEWCFQVKIKGEVVYTAGTKKIEKSVDDNHQLNDVRDYLIAGIGMWIRYNNKKLKDEKKGKV